MKCFNHNNTDATATCQGCGKGLCGGCSSRFSLVLCEPCLMTHNKSVAREIYIGLLITGIIFMCAALFFNRVLSENGQGGWHVVALMPGLLFSFSYWGWKFLNKYVPSLAMASIPVWGFYLVLKLCGAYFLGIIVGPFQIYKMIKELHKVKTTERLIASGAI